MRWLRVKYLVWGFFCQEERARGLRGPGSALALSLVLVGAAFGRAL